MNGFDPASDLTLVNATAELVYRTYDTRLGYRVRITPTVWGESVAVSVPANVVTHAETSVGNQASDESGWKPQPRTATPPPLNRCAGLRSPPWV